MINSQGIVLYSDSVLEKNKAEFNMDKKENINTNVTLKGNTLKAIKNGDETLVKDKDYTLIDNVVTINKDYISKALTGENLSLDFIFNPMAVETNLVSLKDTMEITKHIHTPEKDDGDCSTEIKCSACKVVTTEKKNHQYDTWSKDKDSHWYQCTNEGCTHIKDKGPHNYNITGEEIPPTYFQDGERTDSCICGHTKKVVLDKLVDKIDPKGEISIGSSKWNEFLNKITFGLFFKETQVVNIAATDEESGIKSVEYLLSETPFNSVEDVKGQWTEVSKSKDGYSFNIAPNSKQFIYSRIIDNQNNTIVINSQGIVLYSDSAAITTDIVYEKLSDKDKTVKVSLNGNTVKSILVEGTELTSNQYSLSGNIITLKSSYLETLNRGDHIATVCYNPMNVEFDHNTGKGDIPKTTTFTIKVLTKEPTVSEFIYTAPSNLTYDGGGKAATVVAKDNGANMGKITIKYYNGDTLLQSPPINSGTYTVKIDVEESGNYSKIMDLTVGTFTIVKANQEKPATPVGVHCTTLQNNDGKIIGVHSTMEYQKKGNTHWNTINGTEITGLDHGEYFVRYGGNDNYNPSEAIQVTILKFVSKYDDKVVSSSYNEATISGKFTNGAKLVVVPISENKESYNSLIKLADASNNNVIGAYELTIINGSYEGKLTLSFNIDGKYNGKELTIYHQKSDGTIETLKTTCNNSKAIVTVDELSPFLITVGKDEDGSYKVPGTGDKTGGTPWMLLMVISMATILTCSAYKKRKKTSEE